MSWFWSLIKCSQHLPKFSFFWGCCRGWCQKSLIYFVIFELFKIDANKLFQGHFVDHFKVICQDLFSIFHKKILIGHIYCQIYGGTSDHLEFLAKHTCSCCDKFIQVDILLKSWLFFRSLFLDLHRFDWSSQGKYDFGIFSHYYLIYFNIIILVSCWSKVSKRKKYSNKLQEVTIFSGRRIYFGMIIK